MPIKPKVFEMLQELVQEGAYAPLINEGGPIISVIIAKFLAEAGKFSEANVCLENSSAVDSSCHEFCVSVDTDFDELRCQVDDFFAEKQYFLCLLTCIEGASNLQGEFETQIFINIFEDVRNIMLEDLRKKLRVQFETTSPSSLEQLSELEETKVVGILKINASLFYNNAVKKKYVSFGPESICTFDETESPSAISDIQCESLGIF